MSAEQLKEKANDHFKRQEYDKAVELYSEAIEVASAADATNPALATYYGNRSISK